MKRSLGAAKAYLKGSIRRRTDALLPRREIRDYQRWITERQTSRKVIYTREPSPGLFSILTPVWNGSPIKYLRELARSISVQNANGASEWVVLDNGCSNTKLLEYLRELRSQPGVKLVQAEANLGITRGLRRCLEEASGQYVMPVDGDDLLYPDALRISASVINKTGFPPLLYTDEDKVIGSRVYQPYFKPDWDPVLLLNSAYIAHLGVIDRAKALALGAYSDPATEGSPDWDLFVRFLRAGHLAVHIPEIVYSWRVHVSSTADDPATKPYILSSQRCVLQGFLNAHPKGKLFDIEKSPLLGDAHWHFRRKEEQPKPFAKISGGDLDQCRQKARSVLEQDGFVYFMGGDVQVDNPSWQWEALGITELHPDTVMVGGLIRNSQGQIVEAGLQFDPDGVCTNPNYGKPANDPGYFGQTWKQRSVGAVSTRFSAVKARFLIELLRQSQADASLARLGTFAGAYAAETGRRIVYTPFLSALSNVDWDQPVSGSN
ncbi:MAG: glycosyltransferase [Acidobacteriaceae bacterium]|nr:glycosyltransferase [Acidobacteriaceae bacterium]